MKSDESTRKEKKKAAENDGAAVNDVEAPEIFLPSTADFVARSAVLKKAPSRGLKGNTPTKSLALAKHPPAHPKDDEKMLARLMQPPAQQDAQLSLKNPPSKQADGTKRGENDRDETLEALDVISTRRIPIPRTVSSMHVPGSELTPKGIVRTGERGRIGAFAMDTRAPGEYPTWAENWLTQQQNNPNQEEKEEEKVEEPTSSVAPSNIEDDLEEQPDDNVDRNKEKWFDRKKIRWGFLFIFLATLVTSVLIAFRSPTSVDEFIQGCNYPDTIKRIDRYLDFKSELEFMNVTGFDDPCEPGTLALAWLADADNFESSSISNADLYQRYAMVLFYLSTNMNSTIFAVHAGKVENPWLTDEQVCLWAGITCSNSPEEDTVAGSIDEIEWTTYNIETLNLADNEFSGPIPGSIGSLTNIVTLSLESNEISGTLSQLLGNLHNLGTRNCGFYATNYLIIPSEIGNMGLIERLIVNANFFAGSIPTEIGMLTNLLMIKLNSNSLEGSIPSEIGQLTRLKQLSLQTNDLTQDIPTEFGMLSDLKQLQVDDTFISTQVPAEAHVMGKSATHESSWKLACNLSADLDTSEVQCDWIQQKFGE
eukprot:scaffold18564_cov61-Attheya_sp.AAC.1